MKSSASLLFHELTQMIPGGPHFPPLASAMIAPRDWEAGSGILPASRRSFNVVSHRSTSLKTRDETAVSRASTALKTSLSAPICGGLPQPPRAKTRSDTPSTMTVWFMPATPWEWSIQGPRRGQ